MRRVRFSGRLVTLAGDAYIFTAVCSCRIAAMHPSNPQPAPSALTEAAAQPAPLRRRRMGIWLSAITITLGVCALLLAILPAVIYDEPFRWPWDTEEEKKANPELTLKTKRFQFTLSTNKPAQPAAPEPAPPSPAKPYRIAMIILSALGLGFAPLAWVRERHRPLAGTGATLCCVALFWQYLVAGIVVGVAIAMILLMISMLN